MFRLKVLRSSLSVGFGVDDAAVVVTTASLTVDKLTKVSMQLVLGILISKSPFTSFMRDVKSMIRYDKQYI